MSNQALGEWTNVGGAIDMKVYTEELDKPLENIPMNLAAPHISIFHIYIQYKMLQM